MSNKPEEIWENLPETKAFKSLHWTEGYGSYEYFCVGYKWKDKQIKILKEALEFYANRNNWRYSGSDRFDCNIDHRDAEKIKTGSQKDTVGGKKAREALKQIEEMGK